MKNKLKEEKKVHTVEKQIYLNQINKLKRIVVGGGEGVGRDGKLGGRLDNDVDGVVCTVSK